MTMPAASEFPSPSVAHLVELVRRGVSGELICASDGVEVHVHLQAGRVAWATDSLHPFLFTRHLQEHASVSKEQFREVLEECRRNHLRMGETLVAWKLVSMDQVRAALAHQIRAALSELAAMEQPQRVFLPRDRAYREYATEFTFDISEFEAELSTAPTTQTQTSTDQTKPKTKGTTMANVKESLPKLTEIDGFVGACIVDSNSGMTLGAIGGTGIDLEAAAAGNTEVVRAKRKTMKALNLNDAIEDMLITLGKAYHLIRPLGSNDALFIYLVLDRSKSNLAMARNSMRNIEKDLVVS
jgi:hypothetical protein